MRISDWSSDVCSSDLDAGLPVFRRPSDQWHRRAQQNAGDCRADTGSGQAAGNLPLAPFLVQVQPLRFRRPGRHGAMARLFELDGFRAGAWSRDRARGTQYRSEEHTSELQSLMRISYAVFCLKKKNYNG